MKFGMLGVLASVMGILAFGCSTRPTVTEVIDTSAQPICAKIKECAGDEEYAKLWPDGVEQCVTVNSQRLKDAHKDQLDKASVCTDHELDLCLQNLKNATCPADYKDLRAPCDC